VANHKTPVRRRYADLLDGATPEQTAADRRGTGRDRCRRADPATDPGQIRKHWLGLHQQVGPIHWAGEHTERLNGYMNSAVASGERVAREISGN
jgi:monoamine oxidase